MQPPFFYGGLKKKTSGLRALGPEGHLVRLDINQSWKRLLR
jgi:hypothetical protein